MGDEGKGTKKKGKLKKWILGIGGFLVFLMIASSCGDDSESVSVDVESEGASEVGEPQEPDTNEEGDTEKPKERSTTDENGIYVTKEEEQGEEIGKEYEDKENNSSREENTEHKEKYGLGDTIWYTNGLEVTIEDLGKRIGYFNDVYAYVKVNVINNGTEEAVLPFINLYGDDYQIETYGGIPDAEDAISSGCSTPVAPGRKFRGTFFVRCDKYDDYTILEAELGDAIVEIKGNNISSTNKGDINISGEEGEIEILEKYGFDTGILKTEEQIQVAYAKFLAVSSAGNDNYEPCDTMQDIIKSAESFGYSINADTHNDYEILNWYINLGIYKGLTTDANKILMERYNVGDNGWNMMDRVDNELDYRE